MGNEKSRTVLSDSKYSKGAVTSEFRYYLLLLLLVLTLSSLFHSCDTQTGQTNITTDGQALLAFKLDTDPAGVLNWSTTTSPCTWPGIKCFNQRVYRVWLNDSQLSGTFAEGTLGQLDQLRYLVLANNNFQGSIPDDAANITTLSQLWAQNANFSGSFPKYLSGNLKEMNLSGNSLSGQIQDLSNMPVLRVLDLSVNSFAGPIPALPPNIQKLSMSHNYFNDSIPSPLPSTLVSLDLSDNQLSGQIPSDVATRFPNTSFEGNAALCGNPTSNSCPPAQAPESSLSTPPPLTQGPGRHKKHVTALQIIGWIVGNAIGLAMIALVVWKTTAYLLQKYQKKPAETPTDATASKVTDVKTPPSIPPAAAGGGASAEPAKEELTFVNDATPKFGLEDLFLASAEILGKGSLGTTYKARLDGGNVVAVKRLKDVRDMEQKEFEEQMEVLGRLRHPNLLPLRAYYHANDEKLLVYDYMYNGSLASMLHGGPKDKEVPGQRPFDWDCRLKVACDVALALSFLHEKCPAHMFPHQNLKSSNVLLGDNYEACLADYCLVPLMTSKRAAQLGMTGYAAPEYNRSKKKSHTADVYSFGVLLLELLTGRRQALSSDGEGVDLPKFVKAVRDDWSVQVFDLQLKTSIDGDAQMVTVLQMAMRCVEGNRNLRPPFTQVVKVLEGLRHTKDDGSSIDSKSTHENSNGHRSKDYDSRSQGTDSATYSPAFSR